MFRRLAVVCAAVLLVGAGGCRRSQGDAAAAVEATKQAASLGAAALYVDVRTPQEYATAHVAGAINIPVDEMPQRWPELAAQKDKPIVLYCTAGVRAARAQEVLEQHGFTRVVNGGGIDGLAAQGVPVTR